MEGDMEGDMERYMDFSDSPEAKFPFPFGFDLDWDWNLAWGLSIVHLTVPCCYIVT